MRSIPSDGSRTPDASMTQTFPVDHVHLTHVDGEQHLDGTIHHFLGAVAEEHFRLGVRVEDRPAGIDDDEPVWGVLEGVEEEVGPSLGVE